MSTRSTSWLEFGSKAACTRSTSGPSCGRLACGRSRSARFLPRSSSTYGSSWVALMLSSASESIKLSLHPPQSDFFYLAVSSPALPFTPHPLVSSTSLPPIRLSPTIHPLSMPSIKVLVACARA